MTACQELSMAVGTVAACNALDIARPTYYRQLGACEEKAISRPASPRDLSADERQEVLDVLHSERFVDRAPADVYATLLDESVYHCSVRTMYRVLEDTGEVGGGAAGDVKNGLCVLQRPTGTHAKGQHCFAREVPKQGCFHIG